MPLAPSVAIRRLRRKWGPTDWITVEVPPEQVPFAVPVEAWHGHVGPRFIRDLAERLHGDYERDPAGIGLMDDFGRLAGPGLDPERVAEAIQGFYEHTSRFSLAVRPEWKRLFLPAFWLFRTYFARHVGQFNLPMDERDEKAGIESHIDAVDIDHDKIVDLRGWIRTYAGTEKVIYVGIYTVLRLDGAGYVSVGFPLPNSNLTATLIPTNVGEHDFLLSSRPGDARYSGDYIVLVDETTDELTVFRIRGLREAIHVFVDGGRLFTDHRFYFLGANFLTLHYTITPLAEAVDGSDTAALIERAAAAVAAQASTRNARSTPSSPRSTR
jgi:hypothetical protein